VGCPRLTYEPLLKPVYRAGERELTREEKVSRKNPKRTVERGLFYYGARYYDPRVSVWLSVDPLAHKYPHVSPYNFVENNPLRLVDPTVMGPEDGIGPEKCPGGFGHSAKNSFSFRNAFRNMGAFFKKLWRGGKQPMPTRYEIEPGETETIPISGQNNQSTDVTVPIKDMEEGGTVKIDYNAYQARDRIVVNDADKSPNENPLFSTPGAIGGTGTTGSLPEGTKNVRVRVTPGNPNGNSRYDLDLVYTKAPTVYRIRERKILFGLITIRDEPYKLPKSGALKIMQKGTD